MILRILILVLALNGYSTPSLSASCDRGTRLIAETPGSQGVPGVPGIPGAPGVLGFSDFYALMTNDNAAPVAAAGAVEFPRDGGSTGTIVRNITNPSSSFVLPAIGTYLVEFQVSVSSAGQLMLRLNGGLVANSVVGRATGSDQLVAFSLVTTTSLNSILEVINPPGNPSALIITPLAGGTQPVSAHLTVTQIQ